MLRLGSCMSFNTLDVLISKSHNKSMCAFSDRGRLNDVRVCQDAGLYLIALVQIDVAPKICVLKHGISFVDNANSTRLPDSILGETSNSDAILVQISMTMFTFRLL